MTSLLGCSIEDGAATSSTVVSVLVLDKEASASAAACSEAARIALTDSDSIWGDQTSVLQV